MGNQALPLIRKSRLNSSLVFEKESNFKAGLEAYYSGGQFLSDGSKIALWTVGVFSEKTYGKLTYFINAETSQTRDKVALVKLFFLPIKALPSPKSIGTLRGE